MKHLAATALFLAATLAGARSASADAGPKINPGWWGSVGGPLAIATHAPAGFVTGLEASVFHIDGDMVWLGAYGDGLRDFGTDAWRLSVGPEVGLAMFGIDGGYLIEKTAHATRHGFALRPMFTLGFVALFTRLEHLRGDDPTTFFEVGLLFKLPFQIDTVPYMSRYQHGGVRTRMPRVAHAGTGSRPEPPQFPGIAGWHAPR